MVFVLKAVCVLTLFYLVNCILEVNMKKLTNNPNIPPTDDDTCMARYIVHNSDWCSLAYVSQKKTTFGLPLARIFSISDGLTENSTGIVYFMISPLDLTVQDLMEKNNCSISMSLAQGRYCNAKHYDAQDPRCAQVILSGNFIKISDNSAEFQTAKTVLWNRHPVMKLWYHDVPGHEWFFAKLFIQQIAIVDMFGGRKFPAVKDYFNKNCSYYVPSKEIDLRTYHYDAGKVPQEY